MSSWTAESQSFDTTRISPATPHSDPRLPRWFPTTVRGDGYDPPRKDASRSPAAEQVSGPQAELTATSSEGPRRP